MKYEYVPRVSRIQIVVVFLCLLLYAHFGVAQDIHLGNMKADKILFLGNSVTYHPTIPEVPDWHGDWGMAASAAANDYAHLATTYIADRNNGNSPAMIATNVYLYGMFEQKYPTYNVQSELGTLIGWGADILVTQIGDNSVSNPDPWPSWGDTANQAAFYTSFGNVLTAFKNTSQHPEIFVLSTFWPNSTMDGILEQACTDAGGTFVNIGFSGNSSYIGGWGHPNDAGMAAIANALEGKMAVHAPEPGSLILLAAGLLSLLAYAWRKRK